MKKEKEGVYRFVLLLVLIVLLFAVFSIKKVELFLAPPDGDHGTEETGFCGDGILQEEVGRIEICDYAATDLINNPYGPYCGSDCMSISSSKYFGWYQSFGWYGCKGDSISVCEEFVPADYFINNPECKSSITCNNEAETFCNPIFCPRIIEDLKRGDLDGDGMITRFDLNFFNFPTDTLWLNWTQLKGQPVEVADVNGDGSITPSDSVALLNYISSGSPEPVDLQRSVNNSKKGDLNKDGFVGTLDIEFLGKYLVYGDPLPDPLNLADVNNDTLVDYDDFNYLIEYVYYLGPAPVVGELVENPKRGDINKDGIINSADVDLLLDFLYHDGEAPEPLEIADVNADGDVNIKDVSYLTNYLNNNGPSPPEIVYCDADSDDYACVGTTLYSCNESRGVEMWIEQEEDFLNMCGTEINASGDRGEESEEISIFIYSPKQLNYTSLNLDLKVKDLNDLAEFWEYSLNNRIRISFIPNITITATKGLNTLIVYASNSSDFSYEEEKRISFRVVDSPINSSCGDGICDSNNNETSLNCLEDCEISSSSYCGDGSCDLYEDALNCAADCGTGEAVNYSYCGDGVCDYDEDEDSCPDDCSEEGFSNWIFIVLIIVILSAIVFVIFFFIKKNKKIDEFRNSSQEFKPGFGRPGFPATRRPGSSAIRRPPVKRFLASSRPASQLKQPLPVFSPNLKNNYNKN